MPFHLEKGPELEVLEDFLNSSTDRAVDALGRLRSGVPLAEAGGFDSTSLDHGPNNTFEARLVHFQRDWLGMRRDASGRWHDQRPFDPVSNPTTGFWKDWYGDADGILRTTFIRAIEVSLGLSHGALPGPSGPDRHWPIDLYWKCPQPWLEGWIGWRGQGTAPGECGQVTVILATPGNGQPVLLSPLAPPARNSADYCEEPADASAAQGLWVVTHRQTLSVLRSTVEPTESGDWVLPSFGPLYHGDMAAGIVTVAPCEADGGVLAGGRNYTAPAAV